MAEFFITGLMGTGKTYWVKKMAPKFKLSQYDLDTIIETGEKKSIAAIFENHSEHWFRTLEGQYLRGFSQSKNFILATGGGTPCFNNNMEWMNQQGITIWIDEPIDVLSERLEKEKAHRPLIKDLSKAELSDFLIRKLEERIPYYSKAKYHLKGNAISPEAFDSILKIYV